MKKILKIAAILLLIAGGLGSCGDNGEDSLYVTGTVVGKFSNNCFVSLLLEVDKKYPIGKTIEHTDSISNCIDLQNDETCHNIIQVQASLEQFIPLSELSDSTIINKKISFSYREYRQEEDENLFNTYKVCYPPFCTVPDVPMYVITECQLLKQ